MLKQVGDYEIKETLGKGAFGLVRKVSHNLTKKEENFSGKML